MKLFDTLAHLFYPRYSNNQKAKFLHSSSLFILAFVLIVYQFFIIFLPSRGVSILGYASSISTDEVIRLINNQRQNDGLPPLEYNAALAEAAKEKGDDMLAKGYWAHIAPDGTQPWYFYQQVGYNYRYAGENLARDFSSAQSAVDAWMASPSHRENILSDHYKDTGVAVVEGKLAGVDTTIIVQEFGTKMVDTTPAVPIASAQAASPAAVALSQTAKLTPTPSPEATITPAPTGEIVQSQSPSTTSVGLPLLVSPFDTTKSVSLATIVLLLVIMVIDGIVTARRKTSRVGGRTFAHIAFLGMILAIILIAKAGQIL